MSDSPRSSQETPSPNTKKVAILGLKGAGKSTFLTVLSVALARKESPWSILAADTATVTEMNQYIASLFQQRLYPPTTSGERTPILRFKAEMQARYGGLIQGDEIELQATDVPGEAMKGIIGASQFHSFYENYVRGCSAVIFLIDVAEEWLKGVSSDPDADPYFPVFSAILSQLGLQGAKSMYAALCVTKLDLEYEPHSSFDKEGYADDLEERVARILGPNTKSMIDQFFDPKRIRWFAVSATGYAGEGKERTTNFVMRDKELEDGSTQQTPGIRSGKFEPIGVSDAVEWILNSIRDDDVYDVTKKRLGNEKYAGLRKMINRLLG